MQKVISLKGIAQPRNSATHCTNKYDLAVWWIDIHIHLLFILKGGALSCKAPLK
jgi:hypothetical protein